MYIALRFKDGNFSTSAPGLYLFEPCCSKKHQDGFAVSLLKTCFNLLNHIVNARKFPDRNDVYMQLK